MYTGCMQDYSKGGDNTLHDCIVRCPSQSNTLQQQLNRDVENFQVVTKLPPMRRELILLQLIRTGAL